MDQVNWTHPFYEGVFRAVPSKVDWPSYDRILNRTPTGREEMLIEAANGAPYLSLIRGSEGQGDIYLLSTCLETGNLVRHGLFVPSLLRMAESSRSVQARQLFLGRDQAMTLTLSPEEMLDMNSKSTWSIEGVGNSSAATEAVSIVPEVRTTSDGLRLGWGEGLKEPGIYEVKWDGLVVASFGLNPRKGESELTSWLAEEWTATLRELGWSDIPVWRQPASQLGRLVEKHIAGERLAWYFFLVALTALAFETLFTPPMEQPVLLKSVKVHDPQGPWHGKVVDVLMKQGRIDSIATSLSNADAFQAEASGSMVSPGWVDAQAHFREPGDETKEGMEHGLLAATQEGTPLWLCCQARHPAWIMPVQ